MSSTEHTEDHGHHGPPIEVYYKIFSILIVLTFVTIGVGQVTFLPGSVTLLAAMVISTVKATLVCRYFMLLGYSDKFYTFILLLSLFMLGLMFLFTSIDWSTRDEVNPDLGPATHSSILIEAPFSQG